jgi:hypothetical protein
MLRTAAAWRPASERGLRSPSVVEVDKLDRARARSPELCHPGCSEELGDEPVVRLVGCVNSACLQICEFASPGPEFRHPTGDGGSSSPSDASPNSGLRHESSCGVSIFGARSQENGICS